MNEFREDELREQFERLSRERERRRIIERIAFMDDMLMAFGATQTKNGGRDFSRARRELIRQYDSLSDTPDSPSVLGDVIQDEPKLGDLLV